MGYPERSFPKSDGTTEPGLLTIVGDIFDDTRKLIRQEIDLLRTEIRVEMNARRRQLVGGTLLIGASVWLSMAMALLLREKAGWPLYACFGFVGLLFAVIGLPMIAKKKRRILEDMKPKLQPVGKIE